MRNILTAGIGTERLACPKAKEAATPTKKYRAAADFQTALQTARGENSPNCTATRDVKTDQADPENENLKGLIVAKDKKMVDSAAENMVPLQEKPDELPETEKVQDSVTNLDAAASQATGAEMPLVAAAMLTRATGAGLATKEVADVTETPAEPTPTPAPTPAPRVTKTKASLVATREERPEAALFGTRTVLPVPAAANQIGKQVAPELIIADDSQMVSAPPVTAEGVVAPRAASTETVHNQAVPTTVIAAGTTPVNPAMAVKLTTLPQQPERVREVSTNPTDGIAAPRLAGELSRFMGGDGFAQPAGNLADNVSLESRFTGSINPMGSIGAVQDEPVTVGADTTAVNDVTSENSPSNLNLVMAGAILQKKSLQSSPTNPQPGAGNTPLLSALASLTVPEDANNRLAQTKPERLNLSGGMALETGAASTEIIQENSTLTGLGQPTLRQAALLNHGDTANNPQSSPEAAPNQTVFSNGTNSGVMVQTALMPETAPTASDGAGKVEREAGKKLGLSPVDLPDAAVLTTPGHEFQVQHAVVTKETPAVTKNEVFTQIAEQAKLLVHQGQSELEMSLKPEHLGRLKLKIAVEHQVVTAQFTVESEQVKQIIESNLVQLRKMLQDAGTQVQNLTVNVGQHYGDANYSQQQSYSGGTGNQQMRQADNAVKNVPEYRGGVETNHVTTKTDSLVDLIA